MTFPMARWIPMGCFVGMCVLVPALLVDGFMFSIDPVTGEEKYVQPLKCSFRRILYRFDMYEHIMRKTLTYTIRTNTDCCYRKASRNHCCLYYEDGQDKCKCSSVTTCGQVPVCAQSFRLYKGTTCVGVVRDQITAAAARTRCKNADPKGKGLLAVIKNMEYNDFIKNQVVNGLSANTWIGLQRLSDGGFGWIENGAQTPLGAYNNWNTGRPVTTMNTDCTVIDTNMADKKWNNVVCTTIRFALCQYDL